LVGTPLAVDSPLMAKKARKIYELPSIRKNFLRGAIVHSPGLMGTERLFGKVVTM